MNLEPANNVQARWAANQEFGQSTGVHPPELTRNMFQVSCKLTTMAKSALTGSAAQLVSVGYAGRSVEGLCADLADLSVSILVDVRLNAISRKPGFSKRALRQALETAGIAYQHEPLLGNPADNRQSFRTGDTALGCTRFRRRLENGSADALQRLSALASHSCVAILCVEREERECHRQVILEAVASALPGVPIARLS